MSNMSKKRKVGSASEYVCESWSRTEQNKVRGRHFWTIDDFLRRASTSEVGDSILSPVFSVSVDSNHDSENLTFQLEVFPNGEEGEDNSDYVAVFLTSRRLEELEVKYDFSVQKVDGSNWSKIGNTFKKFTPDQNSWGYGKAFSKAKLSEKSEELLPSGRLTIICNLEIFYGDRMTEGKKARIAIKTEDTPSLGDCLSLFPKDDEFSDVELVCCERVFKCHKLILATRSDVFRAMFSHDNIKEADNRVQIEDMEADALHHFIRFLYTDKLADDCLNNHASELLTAADKYNVPRLKAMCEEYMCENITVSNVAKFLILGYLHEAKNLQTMAIDFVTREMVKVAETEGWNVITESHPKILNEVLKAMTTKLN